MTDTKLIAFFQLKDRLHVSECNAQKQKKKQHTSNAHSVQGEQAQ
jgi:hypothetical protein